MEKIFFIVGWLLGIIPAATQTNSFFKVLDPYPNNHNINDKATNIFQVDSFYYLIDGFSDEIPGRSQRLIKLDMAGNSVKETVLEGPYNDLLIAEGGGHFITHDGYILFTGEWFNTEIGKMGTFLIKMDADLNVIWSQYYSNATGNGNYYGAGVVETDDGQHYLLYASSKSTYLLKTDTSGTLLWSKVIPDEVPQSINGNMIKTQDGHVLITTYVYVNNNPGSYDYTASMAKVDYNGNLVWRKDVDNYTNSGEQQEPMATLLHNGGFAVAWANDSFPWIPNVTIPNFSSLYIMDPSGIKQREVRFDRYGLRSIFSLITASNGDIIAGGYNYEASGGQEKGWLFRATPEGDILWERYFSDSLQRPWSPIFFYDIIENTDGNIVCVGDVEDSIPSIGINVDRNINMVLLITDHEGCLHSGCPSGLQYITAAPEASHPEPLQWLEVAPNPANDILKVNLPALANVKTMRLELWDAVGRVAVKHPLNEPGEQEEIDISLLLSGYYILVLYENGVIRARNKIIIQH